MPKARTAKIKLAHKTLPVVLVVLVLLAFLGVKTNSECAEYYQDSGMIILGNSEKISVELANNQLTRTKGLSGRSCIPTDQGMLFAFDQTDLHGIWMKDMNFNIDIVWLDADRKIVHLEQNISPSTYPKIFYPPSPAKYVIELAPGTIRRTGIKLSNTLNF